MFEHTGFCNCQILTDLYYSELIISHLLNDTSMSMEAGTVPFNFTGIVALGLKQMTDYYFQYCFLFQLLRKQSKGRIALFLS